MNDFTDRVKAADAHCLCYRCIGDGGHSGKCGDPVVTDEAIAAQRDRLKRALSRLLRAFPRLASEHSSTEQQAALRVALCALEETP